MAVVELIGVTKRWGPVTAVEPTDLRIDDGEFVASGGLWLRQVGGYLFILPALPPTAERFASMGRSQRGRCPRPTSASYSSPCLYPTLFCATTSCFPGVFRKLRAVSAERVKEPPISSTSASCWIGSRELSAPAQRGALARSLSRSLNSPLDDRLQLDATLDHHADRDQDVAENSGNDRSVTHDQIVATTMRTHHLLRNVRSSNSARRTILPPPKSIFHCDFIAPRRSHDAPQRATARDRERRRPAVSGGTHRRIDCLRPDSGLSGAGAARTIAQIEPMGREILY